MHGKHDHLFKLEATTGFEPVNSGFADRRLGPLGYVAETLSQAPTADDAVADNESTWGVMRGEGAA